MNQQILSQDEVDALLQGITGESQKLEAEEQVEGSIRNYDLANQERIVRGRMPTMEIIGERINPTGRKIMAAEMMAGDYSRVILADEISPDGCRLWDMTTGEKLDKDRFRRDLGGEEEAYQEVARRLGLLQDDNGPSEVLDLSSHRKLRGK